MSKMAGPVKDHESGIYYIRRPVPERLRALVGKGREWKESLRTKDLAIARERFAVRYAESCQAFRAAQAALDGVPLVVASDAPKLADRWAAAVQARWAEDPSTISEFLAVVA